MTLRQDAERAELAIQQALGTTGESDKIVDVIEAVAKRFAERALRAFATQTSSRCECPRCSARHAAAIAAAERGCGSAQ